MCLATSGGEGWEGGATGVEEPSAIWRSASRLAASTADRAASAPNHAQQPFQRVRVAVQVTRRNGLS